MDLRFIPDAQSFADRKHRDTARDAPPDYEPPPFFATAALQHSNVKLTWDATPDERRRALSKKVTPEELRDDDFKVRRVPFRPTHTPTLVETENGLPHSGSHGIHDRCAV